MFEFLSNLLQIEENIPKINGSIDGLVKMSGTPVSNGRVKARVCVAEDITDADNIEVNDLKQYFFFKLILN